MSDLTAFADHCRRMAAAEHIDDCAAEVPVRSAFWPDLTNTVRPDPDCPGCVTDDERALWARLAAEVDDYLAPQPDLFGGNGPEPHVIAPESDSETGGGGRVRRDAAGPGERQQRSYEGGIR